MNKEFDLEAMFEEVSTANEEDFINESMVDEEVKSNPNIKPVATAIPVTTHLSFNKPIHDAIAETADEFPSKRKFITKQVVIDKFNTKCVRILLTPSVCDICAFDVVAKKFGSWDGVPEAEKKIVKKAVVEHKRVAHPLNQNLIVSEDEIPKVWLGQSR